MFSHGPQLCIQGQYFHTPRLPEFEMIEDGKSMIRFANRTRRSQYELVRQSD